MNKQFAVFGVGKFGESVAVELQRLGCEVIAVDKDMQRALSEMVKQFRILCYAGGFW